ncbi:MAG: HlyD family efflux transporter periplasmic adaptor subunit [Cytophagales bacterium]|nr:HlyD family efflux transporter periplasmic adaptor subunit [Cytophagales bacterium]
MKRAHEQPPEKAQAEDESLLANPKQARLLLWVASAGFALLILWAYCADIDQITRAQGQIIASAKTQMVQSPDGGVLQKLLVKEGDAVIKGQVLAVLERSRAQAGVNDSSAKVAALRITLIRLQAEALNQPLHFSAALQRYGDYVRNQTELYAQRQRALKEDVAALAESLKLAKEELAMNEPLLAKGDVSRSDVLRLQRQVSDMQAQITNKRNKYLQDTQMEMTKAQEELRTQEEMLADKSQLLIHTRLLAPADGIVKNIKLNTEGAVLRPTEELMQILPTKSDLIVEAKLKPSEVAFVKASMPATVKLDAYDYSVFGSLRGVVSYISPDTLSEDTKQGELVYYRVHITITNHEFRGVQAKDITLRAGLTTTVEIKTGTRSVFAYLTKPVTKTLGMALGER